MAIDWDRVVVETDNNGVVVSAGQVALLIGADADTVTWGNITGDITQQPDLMQIVDGFVSADSPQFTGTPRTPTPPAGNSSTRIASTAYVQGELDSRDAPANGNTYGRKDHEWSQLGSMASKNTVNYSTDITNKPQLGEMASASDAPADSTYYGRKNGNWSRLGEMAQAGEPPMDGDSNHSTYYGRTHWYYPSSQQWKTEWQELGEMAGVDDVPLADTQYVRKKGEWEPVNLNFGKDLIHVSPDGNDSTGDGTMSNPYKTLKKAVTMLTPIALSSVMLDQPMIIMEAGTYTDGEIYVRNKHVRIVCESGTVTINDSDTAGTSTVFYLDAGQVDFIGNLNINCNGTGIFLENGSSFIHSSNVSGDVLSISTTLTAISARRASRVSVNSLYLGAASTIGVSADSGSFVFIASVDGPSNKTSNVMFSADGGLIMYGECTAKYTNKTYLNRGGLVRPAN